MYCEQRAAEQCRAPNGLVWVPPRSSRGDLGVIVSYFDLCSTPHCVSNTRSRLFGTMAPVGGLDMVGLSKYGGKANHSVSSESPSEDADEHDSGEHSGEDGDFEAEKAQKAKQVPRCRRAVPKGGKGK